MNTTPNDDVSGDLGGDYLRSDEFEPRESRQYRITAIAREHFEARRGRPAQDRWVLTLAGDPPRRFSLNKTNLRTLVKAWGKRANAWIGQGIEIWLNPDIEFGGEVVGGLRLRIPQPKPALGGAAFEPPAGDTVAGF